MNDDNAPFLSLNQSSPTYSLSHNFDIVVAFGGLGANDNNGNDITTNKRRKLKTTISKQVHNSSLSNAMGYESCKE
jgi:hypothetical protein